MQKIINDMETIELKNFLFHKIAEIDDKSFLEAIKTIIASKTDSAMFTLSNEQRKGIMEGKSQIESGEYFSNEQIEAETEKWLQEK